MTSTVVALRITSTYLLLLPDLDISPLRIMGLRDQFTIQTLCGRQIEMVFNVQQQWVFRFQSSTSLKSDITLASTLHKHDLTLVMEVTTLGKVAGNFNNLVQVVKGADRRRIR